MHPPHESAKASGLPRRAVALGGAAACLAPGATPAKKPPWRWLASDYAPIAIRQGPDAGQGYGQRMLDEVLWPALAEHDHELTFVSSARLEAELRDQPATCAVLLRKTPKRAETWLYSVPMIRHLPVGLVVRAAELRNLRDLINARGEISLARYLDRGHVVGVVGNRANGAGIDGLLEQRPQQRRSIVITDANRATMAMVQRQHDLSATLAYSFEVTYFNRQKARSETGQAALTWLAIAEQSDTLLAHAVCGRSPAGQAHIDAINALLRRSGVRERLQTLYETWLDEPERKRLAALRQQMGSKFFEE
ncbi:hypothetical protein [Inhella gelatinilytica]|uniref:Solute-binding protein family 3/N-terminal domain-containing protein n=1 Tax=Inhella gelatinilytica TaxID=2795030 RepID=A0A931IT00_9BURK|nr:hypothetical protein [Inhella gelatinilytica]MBH9552172.1 hypothetical protein [Inhella gelatinilytica]